MHLLFDDLTIGNIPSSVSEFHAAVILTIEKDSNEVDSMKICFVEWTVFSSNSAPSQEQTFYVEWNYKQSNTNQS